MTDPTPVADQVADWRDRLPADVRERLEAQGRLVGDELPDIADRTGAWEAVREQQDAARQAWLEQAIPADYLTANDGTLTPEQSSALAFYGSSNTNLVLAGPAGTGKTHTAYAVLRVCAAGGSWVWAMTAADFVKASAFTGGQPRLVERAARAGVLLLDDLGADRPTEFAVEQLGSLLDERRRERRKTIITTNLSAPAMIERYGERIVSRIVGGALVVKLTGTDRRLTQAW